MKMIEPHYPKAKIGTQPMPLARLLRIYFMQTMKYFRSAPAWVRVTVVLAFCGGLEGLGALIFIQDRMTDWWPTLHQPTWAPPLWTWAIMGLLFNMMAVTVLYRSWSLLSAGLSASPFVGMGLLVVANQLWSGVFFGLESPLAGFLALFPYAALAIFLLTVLWRLDRKSAFLFAPYLPWLAFDFAWTASLAAIL